MRKRLILFIMFILVVMALSCQKGENGNIEISGSVEVREIRISSEVPGKIIEIPVSEGQEISKGDLIAKIDDIQYKIQLSAANIQKNQVELLLIDSEADYKKAKNLFKTNSVSKDVFTKAELQYKINQLKLEEINENIELLNTIIKKTTITAPVSGIVYEKYAETGEVVSAGFPLVLLYDLESIYIKSYIPEKYLGMIRINDEVGIVIDSFPDKKFKGKIYYISSRAEFTPSTLQTDEQRIVQVYEIRIEVLEGKEYFKSGLFTKIIIPKKKI